MKADFDTLVFDCGDTMLTLDPQREDICMGVLSDMGRAFRRIDVELAYLVADHALKQESSKQKTKGDRDRWVAAFNLELAQSLGIHGCLEEFDRRQRAAFAEKRHWRPVEGVLETLTVLKQHYALHVVANWDARLPVLLERVGLTPFFESINDSATLGAEKPDPRIFAAFFDKTGVVASRSLYIGNEYRADIMGSRAVGMSALLMDWHERYGAGVDCPRLTRFSDLTTLLDISP